ncbi:molecular chaperone DnaJ [Candidatus Wirthbacteria bacterium CG2_30_54_11]|uniref:Chaperone protein DnaJ n=1 Tax=Candidatus Wirthbacteria bacterium CG2_30_54_11 TaxID=1817892 RepID=A0A1J5IW21_9BACT|nr:MAG: molecular chaperone DnaJ [Candidatus Wirthbacteria bacterium CG2_30_54_11]
MPNKRDYYDVLGLSKTASQTEIKKAFRQLAIKHHPDKDGGDEAKFKEINEAYEVLSDPKKRTVYDQYGHAANPGAAGGPQGAGGFPGGFDFQFQGGGAEGFGDIFNMFFGGERGGGPGGAQRGSDLEYRLEIGFTEAIFGTQTKISFNRREKCSRCKGSGGEPDAKVTTCSRCNGSGQVRHAQQSLFGSYMQMGVCPECHGEGKTYSQRCSRCKGITIQEVQAELTVRIPPGVDNGSRIRLRGEGEAGPKGGIAGDLYLALTVKKHEYFTREGQDIHYTLPLDYVQVSLGDEVEVPTVYGPVQLKIPAGTEATKVMRLRDKGVPNIKGTHVGDQIVHIRVEVPKSLTIREKQLLLELAQARGKNIRSSDSGFLNKVKEGMGL